jgi:hypothetical protein
MEPWYDYLYVYDSVSGNATPYYGNSSGYVWIDPGYASVRFRFTSDQSINRWGVDVDLIDCYSPVDTTTTTTTTSTSTTTSTTSTTSTTLTGQCVMPGNYPPCEEVSLTEVVDAIGLWASGSIGLGEVIDLINSWADLIGYPPR